MLILVIVVIGIIATHHIWLAIGAFLFHPHVGGLLFAILAVFVLMLMVFRVHVQQMPQVAQVQAIPNPPPGYPARISAVPGVQSQIVIAQQTASPSNSKSKSKPAATSKSNPANESADQPTPLLAEQPVEEVTHSHVDDPITDQKAAGSLPAWTNESKFVQNGDFYVVVRSGKYSDPNVRDGMLDAKLVAAANDVIDNSMFHHPGMAEQTHLDAPYLREHCLDRQFPTPDHVAADDEVFIRLKFDGQFRQEMLRRHHEYQASFRVYQLGGISLASFALLGVIYSFLKLSPQSSSAAGAASSFNSDPATRQSIYINVRSYVRRHPWRFVLGGALGCALGALIAILITYSV